MRNVKHCFNRNYLTCSVLIGLTSISGVSSAEDFTSALSGGKTNADFNLRYEKRGTR